MIPPGVLFESSGRVFRIFYIGNTINRLVEVNERIVYSNNQAIRDPLDRPPAGIRRICAGYRH